MEEDILIEENGQPSASAIDRHHLSYSEEEHMRRRPRKLVIFGVVAVLFAVFSTVALASGLHYKIAPTFTVNNDNTVTATGEVAGAGTSINASLTASYTFTVTCNNPGSDAGPVPGKTGSGSTSGAELNVPADHGNAFFDVTTAPATENTSGLCKKGWTANPGPITFQSATLTITSSNGGTLTTTYPF
jgi:hypothetical protein